MDKNIAKIVLKREHPATCNKSTLRIIWIFILNFLESEYHIFVTKSFKIVTNEFNLWAFLLVTTYVREVL